MKKISVLVLISFFVFVSCNNMTKSKRATIKKVNTKEAPILEFVEIEKFISMIKRIYIFTSISNHSTNIRNLNYSRTRFFQINTFAYSIFFG